MKINDIGEKEMERPSITEKEISKIKELSAAPLESADSELAKEKLNEAKDVMSDRLAQRKETKPVDTPADVPKENGFEHDFAELSDDLNEGSKVPSFGASQGTCRASKTPQNYCTLAGF